MALCAALVALDLLYLLLGPALAPYDPNKVSLTDANRKPSAAHRLGTDNFGRDILSRKLYGAHAIGGQVVPIRGTSTGSIVLVFDILALAGLIWAFVTQRRHPTNARFVTIGTGIALILVLIHIASVIAWNPTIR